MNGKTLVRALAVGFWLAFVTGCWLFRPSLSEYSQCPGGSDDECAAGESCYRNPYVDERFFTCVSSGFADCLESATDHDVCAELLDSGAFDMGDISEVDLDAGADLEDESDTAVADLDDLDVRGDGVDDGPTDVRDEESDAGVQPDVGEDPIAQDSDAEVCSPRTARCSDKRSNAYEICSDSGLGYGDPVSCLATEYCLEGACLDQLCEPGTSGSCNGPFARFVCDTEGSGHTSTPCEEGQYCDDEGDVALCEDQVCSPDETRCTGPFSLETCNASGAAFEASGCEPGLYCDDAGVEATCLLQQCVPSGALCLDLFTLDTCDERGSGSDSVSCPPDEFCEMSAEPDQCIPCEGLFTLSLSELSTTDPGGPTWEPGASTLTIEAWVRVPADYAPTAVRGLVGVGLPGTTPTRVHLLLDDQGRPKLEMRTSSATVGSAIGEVDLRDGAWHHVAGVRTATRSLRVFVDGIAVGDGSVAGSARDIADGPLWIGQIASLTAAPAEIDDIRISDVRRYTDAGGEPIAFSPPRRHPHDENTVALYRLDDGTGGLATDDGEDALHISLSDVSWTEDDCEWASLEQ